MSRARLLKRSFEIDLEHLPNYSGELNVIAAILEAPVIERILNQLGLQARAPPRAQARGQTLLRAVRCRLELPVHAARRADRWGCLRPLLAVMGHTSTCRPG